MPDFMGFQPKRGWDKHYSCTYILVNDNAEINKLSQKIRNVLGNHTDTKEGIEEWLSIRPITDIYLQTTHVQSNVMAGIRNNIVVIYLFIAIAFFTAFITALNYISMNTSQLMSRELEIGMKKVLGISKNQLRFQFVLESLIMIFCITVVSLLLVYAFLPVFNHIVDRDLTWSLSTKWWLMMKVFINHCSCRFYHRTIPCSLFVFIKNKLFSSRKFII